MVSSTLYPAHVPNPAAFVEKPSTRGWSSAVIFTSSGGNHRGGQKALVYRPVTVDGRPALVAVACAPSGTLCVGSLAGLATASATRIVQWSATAFAPTAAEVRSLLESVAPISG